MRKLRKPLMLLVGVLLSVVATTATLVMPADAATNIKLVNLTDGNVYYKPTASGDRVKIAPGHTSATVNRYKLYMIVYSTNTYGWAAVGGGTQPPCVNPGTYQIPTGVSDGSANQIKLDDSMCR